MEQLIVCKKGCLTKRDIRKLKRVAGMPTFISVNWRQVKYVVIKLREGNLTLVSVTNRESFLQDLVQNSLGPATVVPSTKIKQIINEI